MTPRENERRRGALGAWAIRCAAAEMCAIGLAALAMVLSEQAQVGPWAIVGTMAVVGLVEGYMLSAWPLPVAEELLPDIDGRRFVRNTMLVAAGAWVLAMLPSTVMEQPVEAVTPAPGPPMWLLVTMVLVGGAVGGALIGLGQWRAMRTIEGPTWLWIPASALAWSLGIGLDWLGASLPDAETPIALTVLSGLGFGALAGAAVGLVTGLALLRIAREPEPQLAGPPSRPSSRRSRAIA